MKLEVTLEEYKKLSSIGLNLDTLFILRLLEGDKNIRLPERAMASVGILRIKGYFEEGVGLTLKGKELLAKLLDGQKQENPQENLAALYCTNLHALLQQKLIQLTGKKQRMIGSKGQYSFLCNVIDLEKKLRDVFRKYGSLDLEKVQQVLLRHVERSHKAGWDKVYLMEYYIMKDGVSKMVTDLDNLEDTSPDVELSKPLIDPKSMF